MLDFSRILDRMRSLEEKLFSASVQDYSERRRESGARLRQLSKSEIDHN